jgi:hypothetical protein
MDSLFDVQFEVENAIREHLMKNQKTLWDELVGSSIEIDGFGCNDILLREVESHTERFLSQMSDTEMRRIWLDTESGMMTVEQGFDEVDRCEMIRDIAMDVNQAVANEVCQEAQGILKKKRRRRKSQQ